MSSGQLPRWPEIFPKMKRRGKGRERRGRLVIFDADWNPQIAVRESQVDGRFDYPPGETLKPGLIHVSMTIADRRVSGVVVDSACDALYSGHLCDLPPGHQGEHECHQHDTTIRWNEETEKA
ncbi:hypothetical protein SEA_SKOG_67 [Gordonia phage Skog]|uniref:Uncharacterized protein n=1 Tax=Gordonia phage Skog TaxID=2704033 RepID=A0A6G6XJC7_9CAUD|nr:hypothetical protein KHQ85_gp067 [Gordonia phage Skog]QIG58219.1 hypothetical protein SEA_SKOG_67 [Gordonia phage Skog]